MSAAIIGLQALTALPNIVIDVAEARPRPNGVTPAYVILGERVPYTRGYNQSFMYAFCPPLAPATFTDSMQVNPQSFPVMTTFTWSFPNSAPPGNCGVYGFMHVDYLDYQGAPALNYNPKLISTINVFTQAIIMDYGGTLAGFDVISDRWCWVNSDQSGGAAGVKCEIETFWHPNVTAINYFNSVTQIGSYTDQYSRSWSVAVDLNGSVPDFLFMPTAETDITRGSADLGGQYTYLSAHGYNLGAYYVTGVAAGAEPVNGSGSLVVSQDQVTLY